MYEAAACTATSNNLNEGNHGDADRIQMSGGSNLGASHTDNTVYIMNHVATLISTGERDALSQISAHGHLKCKKIFVFQPGPCCLIF